MSLYTPKDPYVLEITSVTWGSKDITALFRSQLNAYITQNPSARAWTFSVDVNNTTLFGPDPNWSITKACVVVWRNTIPTPDGEVIWSSFKSRGALEGSSITVAWDGSGDQALTLPGPGITGRCIIAAYWHSTDRTSVVQNYPTSQSLDFQHGLTFNVNVGTLGPDPMTACTSKQFCVTYGSWVYPGRWTFQVQVGMGDNNGWVLTLPLLFPPVYTPNVYDINTYITFKNLLNSQDVYPQIYGLDLALTWDGRADNFLIPAGQQKDVNLIEQAGCKERQSYVCGFCATDGTIIGGAGESYVSASSSPMARPCALYIVSTTQGLVFKYDYVNFDRTLTYYPRDLRLNIHAVTWGSEVYTDYVRQLYFSQLINNGPPTDTSNSFSIPAALSSFGDDPNNTINKVLIIVYRLAYQIGHTDGVIFGPQDPSPWDPAYTSQKIQPLHTNAYPVLQDIGPFQIATARESTTLSINLLAQPLSPNWTPTPPPASGSPQVVAATWSDRNVTSQLQSMISANGDTRITVGTTTLGAPNPWPSNPNTQFTCLVAYFPSRSTANTIYRTYVQLGRGDPWPQPFTIPLSPPQIKDTAPQWPLQYTNAPGMSDEVPKYTLVNFVNKSGFDVWPQVAGGGGGQVVWDGFSVDNQKWRIPNGSSKTLNLFLDAHCTENTPYGLSFYNQRFTYPPFTGWIVASQANRWKMTLTYMVDMMLGPAGKRLGVLREVVFGG